MKILFLMSMLISSSLFALDSEQEDIKSRLSAIKHFRSVMDAAGFNQPNAHLLRTSIVKGKKYGQLTRLESVAGAVSLALKAESDAAASEKNGVRNLKSKLKLTEPDLTPAQIKRIFKYLLRNLK